MKKKVIKGKIFYIYEVGYDEPIDIHYPSNYIIRLKNDNR